jgi:hypothetical protein
MRKLKINDEVTTSHENLKKNIWKQLIKISLNLSMHERKKFASHHAFIKNSFILNLKLLRMN